MPDTPLPSPSDRLALMLWHIGVAHCFGARGRIAFASETAAGWIEGMVANSSRALREHLAAADPQYLSQHRFSFRRHTGCVEAVCSAWWDLDFRGVDRHGQPLPFAENELDEVIVIVLYVIAAAGLPVPSYITDSGSGCHVVWTVRGLNALAMKRWRALMKALRGPQLDDAGNPFARRGRREPDAYEVAWTERMLPLWRTLKNLGLDRAASDPARVLRLWGSINSKNGRMARCAWPASIGDIHAVDFNGLCDAALPLTRAQLRALRQERKAAREANPNAIQAPRASRPRRAYGSKWVLIRKDLMAVLEHRGFAWFKEHKKRDWWYLAMAVALSQTEGGDAQSWAEYLGPLVGQPVRELAGTLSGVERGMLAHLSGETVDWEGDIRPAFYDYHPATIAEKLIVTDEEAREIGLRILRPAGLPALTPAERQRRSRALRSPDRKTRDEKAEARLFMGRQAWWMRIAGLTVAECARQLDCNVSRVERAIAEADAHPDGIATLETVDAPPEAIQVEAVEIPSFVSRPSIVPEGSPPAIAPTAALQPAEQPTAVQARTVRVISATPFHATIETATATWWWTVVDQGRIEQPFEEFCDLQSGRPADGDRALVDAACEELARAAQAAHQLSRRGSRRRGRRDVPEARRAVARPVPLPPLYLQREVELYREASGGGGLRHRLVAA
ncbi:hypothetical protein [Methylobacterium sp. GXS13]|uniref:hypothetical protein n=1 Tax=Methylobacterium sp. GXS13 TaxID=1730094 RepID=UPI00071C1388|nr:hypothetical protein [Methylobacterium sp. GXS13]